MNILEMGDLFSFNNEYFMLLVTSKRTRNLLFLIPCILDW